MVWYFDPGLLSVVELPLCVDANELFDNDLSLFSVYFGGAAGVKSVQSASSDTKL